MRYLFSTKMERGRRNNHPSYLQLVLRTVSVNGKMVVCGMLKRFDDLWVEGNPDFTCADKYAYPSSLCILATWQAHQGLAVDQKVCPSSRLSPNSVRQHSSSFSSIHRVCWYSGSSTRLFISLGNRVCNLYTQLYFAILIGKKTTPSFAAKALQPDRGTHLIDICCI